MDPRKDHCYTTDSREKMRRVEKLLSQHGLTPKDMSGNTMNSLTYGNDQVTVIVRNSYGCLFRVASAEAEAYSVDRAWHDRNMHSCLKRTMFSFMADECRPVAAAGKNLRGNISFTDIKTVLEAI